MNFSDAACHGITELAHSSLVVLPCSSSVTCSTYSRLSVCLWKQQQATRLGRITVKLFSIDCFFPRGNWAALGGSAIPMQAVAGSRQAFFPQPGSKNQFNI